MEKIPTVFVRDLNARPAYVLPEVTSGCEWVLAGEGTPTRKWDGTCIRYDGAWWARREVKQGKTQPDGFEPVAHDETTGKTVGWEPADQSPFAKALREAVDLEAFRGGLHLGTYELVGPRINGNPEGVGAPTLVRHGYMSDADREAVAALPGREFEQLRYWLARHPAWEGIVFHGPGTMAKIKRRDFNLSSPDAT